MEVAQGNAAWRNCFAVGISGEKSQIRVKFHGECFHGNQYKKVLDGSVVVQYESDAHRVSMEISSPLSMLSQGEGTMRYDQSNCFNSNSCVLNLITDGSGHSEGSWSAMGSVALHYDKKQPTMVLDLSNMSPSEIDATIIHQFGHALGLGHALLKKEDWNVLEGCVDVEVMKKSLGLPAERDFEMQLTGSGARAACNYEKSSVMQYK